MAARDKAQPIRRRAALAGRREDVTVPVRKPMGKVTRDANRRKEIMKLQLEKKGVPMGNRLAKGTSIIHFLPRIKQLTGAAGTSGRRSLGRPTPNGGARNGKQKDIKYTIFQKLRKSEEHSVYAILQILV